MLIQKLQVSQIQGLLYFHLIVTKNGETKDFKILQSSGNSFESVLLKVIESSPEKWKPGVYKGELVDTEFLIPMNVRYKGDSPDRKTYTIDFNYPQ